jgi:hypothetical protein
MVPSDPLSQLVRQPACSARTRHLKIPDVSPSAPRPGFGPFGSTLGMASDSIFSEAGVSERPFARPKRLFPSEPPLRVRRSRPASSAPRLPGLRPVRLQTPFLGRHTAATGKLTARNPLPAPSVRRSRQLSGPCSPLGLLIPPVQRSCRSIKREACLRKTPDFLSLPASRSF